jgi:hypothetical protein
MPLVLALVASALLHLGVVVAPGWVLPETMESDLPPTIDAVLAPLRSEAAPVRPETAPAEKPVPKPPASKPRPPSAAPAVLAAEAPSEPAAVVAEAPAAEPPPAAPPAPAIEPAAPVPAKTSLPGKGRMRYVITRGEGGFVIGESVHSWDHDGFTYRLKSMTETTGIAAVFKPAQMFQTSQGEISAAGLRPREFRHERSAGIDTAKFDWLRRVVAYAGREDSLVEGTQDMLSMYYQLVLLAPRSGSVEIPIATGRKLVNYRFDVIGEETLVSPAGSRQTVHIRTRSGNDIIEMWLPIGEGEQSRGMPLKIRILDRKGEIYDQIADDMPPTGPQ